MNQAEFLSELKEALEGRVNHDELNDILSDHTEFFRDGIAEGQTEEQVSEQLGHPARIALSLIKRIKESDNYSEQICTINEFDTSSPAVCDRHNGQNTHNSDNAADKSGAFAFSSESDSRTEKSAAKPNFLAAHSSVRLAAILIDLIFASLPFFFISPNAGLFSFFNPGVVPMMLSSFYTTVQISSHQWIADYKALWSVGIILSGIWWLVINPLCILIFKGQSLGKKILGIRVVNADGNIATFQQILLREWLGKLALNLFMTVIWGPLPLIAALGSFISATATKNGLTLWDLVAGTRVIPAKSSRR